MGFSTTLELRVQDCHLVLRAREGDQTAVARLIERHRVGLVKVAANILRDPSEAEDVAQEAFIKVFGQLSSLRDDLGFKRYLYQIAVRLCIDRMRRIRPEPQSEIHGGTARREDCIDLRARFPVEDRECTISFDKRTSPHENISIAGVRIGAEHVQLTVVKTTSHQRNEGGLLVASAQAGGNAAEIFAYIV